jgi:hypothetical protein
MEDPLNANNMVLAPDYMHREYEIRDKDKKTWFHAGETRTEFAPLKAALIIDHAITCRYGSQVRADSPSSSISRSYRHHVQ